MTYMTLGTQLRHLIELLDGAVEQSYRDEGLDYRPRFTPVMKALMEHDSLTINEISALAGITQPAATQTVSVMTKQGIVEVTAGQNDARKRAVRLSDLGKSLSSRVRECWQATAMAAQDLDEQLPVSLTETLACAIDALEQQPFINRINAAKQKLKANQA